MANFYGQVISDRRTTPGTRCGNRSIKACAQSWDGSVIVVAKDVDGETIFEIQVDEQTSCPYGKLVFEGTIKELVAKLS